MQEHEEIPEDDIKDYSFLEAARKRRRILITVVVTFSVICLVGAYPGWSAFKTYRSKQFAQEAQQRLDSGEIKNAYQLARSAYLLRPERPDVLRIMGRTLIYIKPAKAIEFLEILVDTPEGTVEDRIMLANLAILLGDLNKSLKHIQILQNEAVDHTEFTLLVLDYYLKSGDYLNAIDNASILLKQNNLPRESLILYYNLAKSKGTKDQYKAAYAQLYQLGNKTDDYGLDALRVLARDSNIPINDMKYIRSRLNNHPDADRSDKLAAFTLSIRLTPDNKPAIISRVIALFDTSQDDDLHKLSSWLRIHGQYRQVLTLVPVDRALQSHKLLLIRLDTLGGMNQWESTRELLQSPNLPLEDFHKHIFLTRYYYAVGKSKRAMTEWEHVVLEAKSDSKLLWYAHNYAHKLNWISMARSVIIRLTEISTEKRKAYEKLIHLEQAQGNTARLLDVYTRMASDYPDEPAVLNDYAYLRLLLKRDIDNAYRTAESLVMKHPELQAHYITMALAELRRGRPDHALNVIRSSANIDWSGTAPRFRAIVSAVLFANNISQEANNMLQNITPENLLPEELHLLKEAQKREP